MNNLFDRIAEHYDSPKQLELAKAISEKIKTELTNSKSKVVLDYGCGTGLVGLALADKFEQIVFVDPSKEMINIVDQKIEQMKLTNTQTIVDHFSKGHTLDLKADVIILSLVLLHIPDTQEILEALYEVLNPKGCLLVVDFDKNEKVSHEKVHNGFSQTDLKQKLETIGYKYVQSETFYHGEQLFMKQDASMFLLRAEK
ncbi:class I SAM-dependent methyltransferase [Enterococcus termitis]|uniref:Methylase n=1 Tax=Enterococcus termitis TaxID=332950 RepID=A0A1E5H4G6_9ENTE|nr:class I SAM-dependent methyltransferase [Enterococcus termitis]OEG19887.1 methylase [Enterococcus termitis]